MPTETEGKTYCTACGAQYAARAKYCGVDGTALKPTVLEAKPAARAASQPGKRCPACNAFFPAHAQYCSSDATRLEPLESAQSQPIEQPTAQIDLLNSVETEKPGVTFAGRYRIERLLGEGGMARVYLATHLDIEKLVVIKLMHNQVPARDQEKTLLRFLQEIKVTASLNHPNLVSVFDGGTMDGRPYLVMEYIKGRSLRQYIAVNERLGFEEAITIALQMLSGLQEAHDEGVIHRDLKPENIMLREDFDRPDWVKVVDFGIAHLKHGGAKLTATGVAIGTVDYMSPEYLGDKPIDHRSDLYAVGVILYELLTGVCPFESENVEAVMAKHLFSEAPLASSLRGDMARGCALDTIIARALAKEPSGRFASAADMRQELMAARANPNG